MKARSLSAAASLGALLMGLSQMTAAAAEAPAPVVINAHPCVFAPVEVGPWEATGAITDSGTYKRTDFAVSPPNATFFTTKTFREEFVFSSSRGTFTVDAEESAVGNQTRVWQINSGSGAGAYADTSGHGTAAFFVTATRNACTFGFTHFTFQLTGVASKVG